MDTCLVTSTLLCWTFCGSRFLPCHSLEVGRQKWTTLINDSCQVLSTSSVLFSLLHVFLGATFVKLNSDTLMAKTRKIMLFFLLSYYHRLTSFRWSVFCFKVFNHFWLFIKHSQKQQIFKTPKSKHSTTTSVK